nr:unnamed protein product [Callosobruchus analis]
MWIRKCCPVLMVKGKWLQCKHWPRGQWISWHSQHYSQP